MTPTPEYALKDFDEVLFGALRDSESATLYLQDAWEDSTEEFLVALRKSIQANGGLIQRTKARPGNSPARFGV